MSETIKHIGDLTPDPRNARKHNPRNVGLIVDALHEVGAARSIVIDEDGTILAGNATVEAAAQAGIEKVRVIQASGEEIIAVQRTGLTERQKVRLALYDNRTAELAAWDPDVLADIGNELDGLFSDWELAELEVFTPDFAPVPEDEQPRLDQKKPTTCPECGHEFVPK